MGVNTFSEPGASRQAKHAVILTKMQNLEEAVCGMEDFIGRVEEAPSREKKDAPNTKSAHPQSLAVMLAELPDRIDNLGERLLKCTYRLDELLF